MHFFSTSDQSVKATFKQALLSGLAPDGGLYLPSEMPQFSESKLQALSELSFAELSAEVTKHFVGDEVPTAAVEKICTQAYKFPTPLHKANDQDYFLELFHGPTAAFKDIAGQFMGQMVSYFLSQKKLERNILVATSGDTGGAIGAGFHNLSGVNVFILFPKGGVSSVQRQQLCTMGGNVQALEVEGTFDDCQALVKQAFANRTFNDEFKLMSANSINVGRVIPQSFYYLWASLQLQQKQPGRRIVFSIPSGNLGNATGAYLARTMGAPIHRLIVANNANAPFVEFLENGEFVPRSSVPTLSNAMDIGHPNNYYRLAHYFPAGAAAMKTLFSGYRFSDEQTARHLREYFEQTGYLMCPHTTVGHLATQAYQSSFPEDIVVTVSTAHPAKFRDEVEPIIGQAPALPASLAAVMGSPSQVDSLTPELAALEPYLESKLS